MSDDSHLDFRKRMSGAHLESQPVEPRQFFLTGRCIRGRQKSGSQCPVQNIRFFVADGSLAIEVNFLSFREFRL